MTENQNGSNLFTSIKPQEEKTAAASEKFISTVVEKKTEETAAHPASEAVQAFVLKKQASERSKQQEHQYKKAHRAFVVSFLFALAVFGFFTVRLYEKFPIFKPNLTQKTLLLTKEKKSAFGKLAGTQLLHTDLLLSEYAFTFDAFQLKKKLLESPFLTTRERKRIEEELAQLKNTLIEYGRAARPLIGLIAQAPKDETRDFLISLRENLPKRVTEKAAAPPEVVREFQHIESTRAYLTKAPRFRAILNTFEGNDVGDETLAELAELINTTGKHPFAIVAQAKIGRLPWTKIIREIDRITQNVDPLYGRGALGDLGGIRYTGYTFDGITKKLSLSGKTKTVDSKNFTLVSNLIDAFEKSPLFRDVTMRSFSKTQDERTEEASGFVGNLDLTLFVQDGDDPRDVYSINPVSDDTTES